MWLSEGLYNGAQDGGAVQNIEKKDNWSKQNNTLTLVNSLTVIFILPLMS